VEVEIRDLVDMIHAAASDPDIVALYGTFGQGHQFQCGGYAHVEEIRNAIRVFNESHRRHDKKSGDGDGSKDGSRDGEEVLPTQKFSYAYADTFDNPTDPGNKEYFLASAFSQVHMQPRGNMNLFGVSMSNFFLSNFFQNHGVKIHVHKHGKYKNAPNSATETGYTRAHRENTMAIVESINNTVYASIGQSRQLPLVFNGKVWKDIHSFGTMTADNAQEIKLVDHLPSIDPFSDLVAVNASRVGESDKLRQKWKSILENQPAFQGSSFLNMSKYSKILKKRKKWQEVKGKWFRKVDFGASRSTATEVLLNCMGYSSPYFFFDKKDVEDIYSKRSGEKVAIVHVTGGINDGVAKKVVKALREVKLDPNFKCVLLRVDSPGGAVTASETILEECKDLSIPVVCSFSNLAASGGYYVSAQSDKIFAQPTTLTGSIGVFGVKIDASEAFRKHGIEFDSVASGGHALTNSLVEPLTRQMEMNLNRNMDRIYLYFKGIVSKGRNMSMEETEKVAQGRVWTGTEAREVGLVDEWGGLEKALSFCKKTYTSTGYADVVVYPKPMSFMEKLNRKPEINDIQYALQLLQGNISLDEGILRRMAPENVYLTMDEESALQIALKQIANFE